MTLRPVLLAVLLSTSSVRAEGTPPPPGPIRVAVLSLEANPAGQEQAPAVGALVGSRLAESSALLVITQSDIAAALGLERQKQLLQDGCTDSGCLTELSNALGARFVVTGRLDRFAGRYVLTASAFDAQRAVAVARPRDEVDNEGELPAASARLSEALLLGMGVVAAPEAAAAPERSAGVVVGIKLGNNFITGLSALAPAGDLVLGYYFDPSWLGFVQVGFAFGKVSGEDGAALSVLPTALGVRRVYGLEHSFQPYWGLGLGLQLAFGQYGPFEQTGPLPTLLGQLGFHYRLTDAFGIGLEGSINVAQAVLGLSSDGQGSGFNFKPVLTGLYRF